MPSGRVLKVLRVFRVRLVLQVLPPILVLRVFRVPKVLQVLMESQALKVLRVLLV